MSSHLYKKQKLISVVLVLAFLILLVVVSWGAVRQIHEETTSIVRDSLQSVLLAVEETHKFLVRERILALEAIASSKQLIAEVEAILELEQKQQNRYSHPTQKQLKFLLDPLSKKFGDMGFLIISHERKAIVSNHQVNFNKISVIDKHHPHLIDKAFAGYSVFVPPIKSEIPAAHSNDKNYHITTMFIASPILDANEQIIAIIAMRLDPIEYFSRVTELGRIGESGETYAFNREGILLTESRFRHQLLKTNRLKLNQNGVLNLRITDPGGNLLQGHQPKLPFNELPLTQMAESATKGESSYNLSGYRDYRGITVLGAWGWIEEFNFGLATEIDSIEALQPYYRTRDTFLTVISVTVLLSLLLLRLMFLMQRESNKQMQLVNNELELRVEERTEELVKAKEKLSQANLELNKLATTDELTGIANRRHFDHQLLVEWQRCHREKHSLAILIFDIDFFKAYNDNYGHGQGDECLKEIAQCLDKSHITRRPGDLLARYGGEEFIILLVNTTRSHVSSVAEKVKDSIELLAIPHKGTKVARKKHITTSVGWSYAAEVHKYSPALLIEQADKALYQAKNLGRNKVCQFTFDNESKLKPIDKLNNNN